MTRRTRLLAAAAAATALAAVRSAPADAESVVGLQHAAPATPCSRPGWTPPPTSSPRTAASRPAPPAGTSATPMSSPATSPTTSAAPAARRVRLEAGESTTSPAVCVGLEHPTFRFVMRRAVRLAHVVAVGSPSCSPTAARCRSARPRARPRGSRHRSCSSARICFRWCSTATRPEVALRFTATSGYLAGRRRLRRPARRPLITLHS